MIAIFARSEHNDHDMHSLVGRNMVANHMVASKDSCVCGHMFDAWSIDSCIACRLFRVLPPSSQVLGWRCLLGKAKVRACW
jgi:hypothetical protein